MWNSECIQAPFSFANPAFLWRVRDRLMGKYQSCILEVGIGSQMWDKSPVKGRRGMQEKQVWGSAHCGHMDTSAGRMPWCCHLYCIPSLVVGGYPRGRGCGGGLGVPLPIQGCKAGECTDMQNEVTFDHRAHDISLPVLCRTTEQRYHVQSTLLFPRLPPGKVCSCSIGVPLSSWSSAEAPLLLPAQVSPCSGWLTPNETLRNLTSEVSLSEATVG